MPGTPTCLKDRQWWHLTVFNLPWAFFFFQFQNPNENWKDWILGLTSHTSSGSPTLCSRTALVFLTSAMGTHMWLGGELKKTSIFAGLLWGGTDTVHASHLAHVGHVSRLARVGHDSRLALGTCFTSDTWDIQQALASFLPSKLCSYKAEPLKGRPVKWFWVPVLSLQGLRSGSQALIWKRWGSFLHLISDQALVWRAKMKPSGSLALAVVLNTPIYATQLLQGHKWGVLAETQKSNSTCPSSLPESHCLFRYWVLR